MDSITRTNLDNIHTVDRDVQNKAYFALIEATDQPVDWAYEVWGDMLTDLSHKDNHVRAIAAQVLCNLAKSDPENRMLKDLGCPFIIVVGHAAYYPRFGFARTTRSAVAPDGSGRLGAANARAPGARRRMPAVCGGH